MSSTSENDTIQSLLHRFLGGCDKSFSDIYTLLVDDLYVYGVSFDISEEVVEDIIQDIFCYLYLNKKKFSQVTNLKSYLFRSLKNRILDTYKKKPCIPFEDALGNELTFSLKVSVEDNYIQDESKQLLEKQINKMLECLNNQQREIIYLRFNEEMTYEEIAELLNCSQEVVRKSISRSIAKIKKNSERIAAIFIYCLVFKLAVSHLPF